MKPTLRCVLSLTFVFAAIGVRPIEAQKCRVLYSFAGGNDGKAPQGWLVRDGKRNLYGVTSDGGGTFAHCQSSYGCGTIFVVKPSGQEHVLYRFTDGIDGGYPFAGLTAGGEGELYGTASSGSGSSRGGTVFRIDARNGEFTLIHGLSDATDGGFVLSGVIRDSHGNLYGTAAGGGNRTASVCQLNGCGVVFEIDPNGNEKVLHTFIGPPDGSIPSTTLIRDPAGNLYGTTAGGGASNCGFGYGCGTIFRIDVHGNETILHSFAGGSDGDDPQAALIRDEEGNLYGTTYAGGTVGYGTVYKLDLSNSLSVLHSFEGPDGANPSAALVRDSAGNLYGTTYDGGDPSCGYLGSGCGVVFRLDPNGHYSLLHRFTGTSDGSLPTGSLLLDAAGNLYGIATYGGVLTQGVYNGVVFKITPE